jgi:cob(I)alamin adenosyltransferase
MIIVFTGNGKGKTTAALGQAIRALGQGKRVLTIQFVKGNWETGEGKFFSGFRIPDSRFKLIKAGKGFVKILGDKLPFFEHKKAGQKALKLARVAIESGKWDLIILDEINVAANLKLIKEKEALGIFKKLPKDRVLILTGRNAPKSFIKVADLATEMKEIKHPFQKGRPAQKGIEF